MVNNKLMDSESNTLRVPRIFRHHLRVCYAETDAAKVVYYANYFVFMERARTECWHELEYNYERMVKENAFFVVAEAQAKYFKPGRLYDKLTVVTTAEDIKRVSIRLNQMVYRVGHPDELLCKGLITMVCVDSDMKPRSIPQPLKEGFYHVPR
jgi:4-hydroxybenzoyl-CoA thioesterase